MISIFVKCNPGENFQPRTPTLSATVCVPPLCLHHFSLVPPWWCYLPLWFFVFPTNLLPLHTVHLYGQIISLVIMLLQSWNLVPSPLAQDVIDAGIRDS